MYVQTLKYDIMRFVMKPDHDTIILMKIFYDIRVNSQMFRYDIHKRYEKQEIIDIFKGTLMLNVLVCWSCYCDEAHRKFYNV